MKNTRAQNRADGGTARFGGGQRHDVRQHARLAGYMPYYDDDYVAPIDNQFAAQFTSLAEDDTLSAREKGVVNRLQVHNWVNGDGRRQGQETRVICGW